MEQFEVFEVGAAAVEGLGFLVGSASVDQNAYRTFVIVDMLKSVVCSRDPLQNMVWGSPRTVEFAVFSSRHSWVEQPYKVSCVEGLTMDF